MLNKIVIVSIFLSVISCSSTKQSSTSNLKLYVLDCGKNEVKDISIFSPGVDKNVSKTLVASCYLIKHPRGILVWDTGLSDSLVKKPDGVKVRNGAFTLKVTNTLISQLTQVGVNPKAVNYLAFSHMHADHTGNANLFTNAKILIQKEEFKAAFGTNPSKYSFNKKTYDKLDPKNVNKLSGDFDVFGDGKVVIKHAKGHTPGHQVLFLNLAHTGPIVLSGDLYHFKKNRDFRRVPSFNFDKDMTLSSMEKIEKFLLDKKAKMWIQHDPDQRKNIRLAPYFYE